MTTRFLISTLPMRPGVSRTFIWSIPVWADPTSVIARLDRQSSIPGQCLLDRPVKPGDDNTVSANLTGKCSRSQGRDFAAVHVDGGAMKPAPAPRYHEGNEAGDVLGRAETGDIDVLAVPFAHLGLALAGALDVGLDAPPEPFGFHIARVDGVDLHVVSLAKIGERLGKG